MTFAYGRTPEDHTSATGTNGKPGRDFLTAERTMPRGKFSWIFPMGDISPEFRINIVVPFTILKGTASLNRHFVGPEKRFPTFRTPNLQHEIFSGEKSICTLFSHRAVEINANDYYNFIPISRRNLFFR